MVERRGVEFVVAHGKVYHPHLPPGFISIDDSGERTGLVTHEISNDECEIATLDTLLEGYGLGTALIEAVIETAKNKGASRVWLITTNDNLNAIGFYQKRGFIISGIHRKVLESSRKLKPSIPLVSNDGIPLRDEIELEYPLNDEESGVGERYAE